MLPACTCEGTTSSGLALIPSMQGTSHEKACHAERSTVQLHDYAAARNDPCREDLQDQRSGINPALPGTCPALPMCVLILSFAPNLYQLQATMIWQQAGELT